MPLLMIRPVQFAFNPQTAVNNAFQVAGGTGDLQKQAFQEFNEFVDKLRQKNIEVIVVDDSPEPHTPDSVFPNNWISFHEDGTLILYPMYAENRRLERKAGVIEAIEKKFRVEKKIDLTSFETENRFLEGTGSMVLDRQNKIAYACLSPRTDMDLLNRFCTEMFYHPVVFHSVDEHNRPIYHTNVMMCVADRYVVICLDTIPDPQEKKLIAETISGSGKKMITITLQQMKEFAGNMLQVKATDGKNYLVMSSKAYHSLAAGQIQQLQQYDPIIHSSLDTIETNGGGSARCMMAEVNLPPK